MFVRVCRWVSIISTLEIFANCHNKQVLRFVGLLRDTNSQGDVFQIYWTREFGWFKPTWALLNQAPNQLLPDQANALALCAAMEKQPMVVDFGSDGRHPN